MYKRVIKAAEQSVTQAAARLGVSEASASDDDVRAAFRRRAVVTHPDRGGSSEQFRQAMADRDVLLDWVASRPGRSTATVRIIEPVRRGRVVDVYA